jgi:hypothetical protein
VTGFALVLLVVGAAVFAIGRWFRRAADRNDKARAEKVRRHGLGGFDARLRDEIARKVRPMDHLSLTRMMIEVLEQLDQAVPGTGQAAVVEPPDEGYRLACEELVTLKRLTRTPGGAYIRSRPR